MIAFALNCVAHWQVFVAGWLLGQVLHLPTVASWVKARL